MIKVTIPSRQVDIIVPAVSPTAIQMQLVKRYPKPKPPKQKVNLFGEEAWEENPFTDEHQKALADHQAMINELVAEVIIRQIAYRQQMTDEKRAQVEQLRREFGDIMDIAEDDRLAWFVNFAMPDGEELGLLMKCAMTQRNEFLPLDTLAELPELDGAEPNSAEVAAYANSFRS